MSCGLTETKLLEAQQLIADFTNDAIQKGLIEMIAGFACPTLIVAGGAEPGSYQFRTSVVKSDDQTTYSGGTFDSIAIGDADPNRWVIIAIDGAASTRTVSSASIGGVAAALVNNGSGTDARAQGGNGTVEFWAANVPSGTTANISVTWSGSQTRCGLGIWTVIRPTSITATAIGTSTAATGANATIATVADGFAIAAHYSNDSNTYSWTNITERYDAAVDGTAGHSGADAATTGASVTPTAGWSGVNANRALVAASFGLSTGNPGPARILDGYSNVTGAWSMSRSLLQSFGSGTRYTTETGVDLITDQTGGGANLSNATDAQQPTATAAGPQNRTAARSDGVNDGLTSGVSSFLTVNDGYIIGCGIMKAVTTNSATPNLNDGLFTNQHAGFVFKNDSGTYSWLAYSNDGSVDSVGSTISPLIDTVIVCEWRIEGGTLYGRITPQGGSPGAWLSTASGANAGVGFLSIGTPATGTAYAQMDFFEMVTFDAVPNDTLKDALVTNMLDHYG